MQHTRSSTVAGTCRGTIRSGSLVGLMLLAVGCTATRPIPDALIADIEAMAEEDQRWEMLVVNRDSSIREPGFFDRKQAMQDENTARCAAIFTDHGLISADRVGPEVAADFWVLVQHSDSDPAFQSKVLRAMTSLPDGSVDASELAMLTDRVRINTGRPQVYGSQTVFDQTQARAYPKPLEDPANVDARRASVGMEPLAESMNGMSEMHYIMNRELYVGRGIDAPWVYPPGFKDWK